jgi:hypothetical protein
MFGEVSDERAASRDFELYAYWLKPNSNTISCHDATIMASSILA